MLVHLAKYALCKKDPLGSNLCLSTREKGSG